jgi:hypothetical protein
MKRTGGFMKLIDECIKGTVPNRVPEGAFVYYVKNNKTGAHYVGQTTQSIRERLRTHLSTNSNLGKMLKDAPSTDIYVEILSEVPVEIAGAVERFCIEVKNTTAFFGLNQTYGGRGDGEIPTKAVCDQIARSRTKNKSVDSIKLMDRRRKTEHSKTGIPFRKAVIGTNIDTGEEVMLTYISERPSEFDPRLISACCRGKRRFHRNHSWRYV